MFREYAKVFVTDDYTVFKTMEDNRIVTDARVKRLVESFKAGEILNPIVVNGKMEIIDGQGRYEAKKKLGLPIYYIVDEKADIEDCRRMNKYNSSWSATDFAISYAMGGNVNYINLVTTAKAIDRALSVTLTIAGKRNGKMNTAITSGDLKFTKADIVRTKEYDRNIRAITDALALSTHRVNRAFVSACAIMFGHKGYSQATMIEHCTVKRMEFVQIAKVADQLKEFEEIYNYRLHPRNKIYFTDYLRETPETAYKNGDAERDYWKRQEDVRYSES